MSTLYLALTVFAAQLVFLTSRTINVRAIARGNVLIALLSSVFIHLSWLLSIAIGVVSVAPIVAKQQWDKWPVIAASLAGGLIGTYFGMIKKNKSKRP